MTDGDIRCPYCGGSGECYTSHSWTCHICKGSGWLSQEAYSSYRANERRKEENSRRRETLISFMRSLPLSDLEKIHAEYSKPPVTQPPVGTNWDDLA